MDICATGHDEIVYNSRNCPLCEANKEIGELYERIDKLEEEVEKLNKS